MQSQQLKTVRTVNMWSFPESVIYNPFHLQEYYAQEVQTDQNAR